jgi:hypothetical protein
VTDQGGQTAGWAEVDLIEEGKLQAINIGGGGRNFWRIPVEAYKAFLCANHGFHL